MKGISTGTIMENKKSLEKSLNLLQLTYYTVGMILGAGIYSIIGKAAGVAGEGLWLSFVIAGLGALLTALSYAELAAIYPQAGAEYVYLKTIFPKLRFLSFLCGTLMVFASIATAATVALAFAGYLEHFFYVPHIWIAILVLLLCTGINIWGIQESAWMNVLFTSVETIGLLIFIYFGWHQPNFGKELTTSLNWGVASGTSLIFFAYLGFESMVNFAEEAKNPERDIPRAIVFGIIFTTILYILVGLAALALMSPQELNQSTAVLSSALSEESPRAAGVLGAIALFATGNTVMIALLAGSRIIFGMSRGSDLPALFKKISATKQTPWVASLLVFALSCAFLVLKRIELVASISSLITILVFIVINSTVIYLRLSKPDLQRPFRVPLSVAGWPLLPVVSIAMSLYFTFYFEPLVYSIATGIILFVLVVYYLHNRRNMLQQDLS